MADTETVQKLVDYYTNLLIIQYHDKPNAKAMIQLLVTELLANGIILDVLNGFDIDTAVGKQLDIIGKYVGLDRFYQSQDLHDYFSLVSYQDEIDPPLRWGFNTYDDFNTLIENGTLNYNSILVSNFSLNDNDYRTLIELRIIQNNSNHSHGSIDDGLFKIFGGEVHADSSGDMHMFYFVPENMTELVQAAIAKEVLPRPMGVGIIFITQTNPFFGFSTYSGITPLCTGFTSYPEYASKLGETFGYENIGEI